MNEHEDGALISAYLDGELEAPELARVGAHLKACAACRVELEGLRAAKSRLAVAPRRALPPDLISGLEDRLSRPARRWTAPAWLGRPRLYVPAGAFAAAALVVGLWFGFKSDDASQAVPLEPLMAAHERYSAESLVPQDSLVAANYTELEEPAGDPQDQEAD